MPITDIETIKQQLAVHRGHFPTEAVRAAVQQREAITPILLDALQAAVDDPEALAANDRAMLHVFALYLLAQFREPAAYPLLCRLFSLPDEICLDLTGDVVTEDLARILASVCDTDLAPMQRMIEDPAVGDYVRSACLTAHTILVCEGRVPREQVIDYFASLFRERLPREGGLIWSSLVVESVDLYPQELLGDIERAYGDGLIDPYYISLKSVQRTLARDQERVLQEARERYRGLIDDTVAEMSCWAGFNMPDPALAAPSGIVAPTQPVVKGKKVGRNDPCPCGSGKKYKKCCLDLVCCG
jgi:hypothetical protein